MARARNIKPKFFKNEDLADMGPMIQLLFAGLWCLADREGVLEDRPRFIKAELFPYYDIDINGGLTLLHRYGFVKRYKANGQPLIHIVKFAEHQSPHSTEKKSTLPGPDMADVDEVAANPHEMDVSFKPRDLTVDSRKDLRGNTPDSLIPDSLIPDSLIPDSLIPDSGLRKPEKTFVDEDRGSQIRTIFEYWKKAMRSSKSALDKKRQKLIAEALKHYTPSDICIAIRGCSKSPFHMGDNARKTKYNGLNLILRSAEYIDQFIALDGGQAQQANETDAEREARIINEFCGEYPNDDNTIEMEGSNGDN